MSPPEQQPFWSVTSIPAPRSSASSPRTSATSASASSPAWASKSSARTPSCWRNSSKTPQPSLRPSPPCAPRCARHPNPTGCWNDWHRAGWAAVLGGLAGPGRSAGIRGGRHWRAHRGPGPRLWPGRHSGRNGAGTAVAASFASRRLMRRMRLVAPSPSHAPRRRSSCHGDGIACAGAVVDPCSAGREAQRGTTHARTSSPDCADCRSPDAPCGLPAPEASGAGTCHADDGDGAGAQRRGGAGCAARQRRGDESFAKQRWRPVRPSGLNGRQPCGVRAP